MKDQPKHTPGPWNVTRTNTGVRSADAFLCRIWMLRNGQGVANARLIAAAPDLLEALKRIYDLPCDCPCEVGDDTVSAYDQALAAIAKAEGRGE